jgi:hypothetical protein
MVLNKKDIPTNVSVRNLVWKVIQNGHKIGEYWSKIPNYEHRGICYKTENMDHTV